MRDRDSVLIGLIGGIVLIALVIVGILSWAVGHGTAKTTTVTVSGAASTPATTEVDPHVAAGAHDFVQFACAQCHGEQGRGGVSPDVPSLSNVGNSLTTGQLR